MGFFMISPRTPEYCKSTGRILTEWFEEPEHTEEYIRQQVMEKLDITEEDFDLVRVGEQLNAEIASGIGSFKRRKWRGAQSKQEVAHRLNEASKLIDPDNMKFLSPEVTARTGMELNPLWQLECLVRSGTLANKEQIVALKELAAYAFSKAPTVNNNLNTTMTPEEWLLELSKEEFKVVDEVKPIVPYQPREKGSGYMYEHRRNKRIANLQETEDYSSSELEGMLEGLPEDFDFDSINGDEPRRD